MLALVVSLGAYVFLVHPDEAPVGQVGDDPVIVASSASARTRDAAYGRHNSYWWSGQSNLPLEGAFTKPEDVVGKILLYPVPPKEPIRNQLLAGPGSAIGLTAKIPDGMRAVAVVTNEVNNVSGFLFPGSHVDVLVTFHAESGKEPMTTTVVQNVEVLSTGERLAARSFRQAAERQGGDASS